MDFNARIRITVAVPFKADGETDEERIAAAIHAEDVLTKNLSDAIADLGEVCDILVEEVYEV